MEAIELSSGEDEPARASLVVELSSEDEQAEAVRTEDTLTIGLRSPQGTLKLQVCAGHTVRWLRREAAQQLGLASSSVPLLQMVAKPGVVLTEDSTMAQLGVRRGDVFNCVLDRSSPAGDPVPDQARPADSPGRRGPMVKKRKQRGQTSPVSRPKMQQGETRTGPTREELDRASPAPKMTSLLVYLFPQCSKSALNKWRVAHLKQHPGCGLISVVEACDDAREDMAVKKHKPTSDSDRITAWRMQHDGLAEENFGMTWQELAYIEARLKARGQQREFEEGLANIGAVDDESGIACNVCGDCFALEDSVHCEGNLLLETVC